VRPRTAAICAALATAAVVGAVVLAGWLGGGASPGRARLSTPLEVESTLSPNVVLFGDTVTAQVDVTVDRTRLDPERVRVSAAFAPWTLVQEPLRIRHDAGSATHLRTTFVLRCLTSDCVPQRGRLRRDFDPARVSVTAAAGGTRFHPVAVQWPTLEVQSRIDADSSDQGSAPWRANAVSLPAVSYRLVPWLVLLLSLVGGILLACGGALLLYLALPKRIEEVVPEPAEAPRVLTPLEQALLLLERPATLNGEEERRRALELVADELGVCGDEEHALAARTLAWSNDTPGDDDVHPIAAYIRSRQEEGTNGDVD
jgi:hypothetical protein